MHPVLGGVARENRTQIVASLPTARNGVQESRRMWSPLHLWLAKDRLGVVERDRLDSRR